VVNNYYYRLPKGFITLTENHRKMLIKRGARGMICVTGNGIDFDNLPHMDKKACREYYGLTEQDYAIALIGRIYFRQKGHDLLINALAENKNKLANIKLFIVGEGPDEHNLKTLVRNKGLDHWVKFVPWSKNPSHVYSAVDMVVIPSRFEGLPQVMIEALHFGLPVIASNLDGMADYLPSEWLFQNTSCDSIIETLFRVKEYPDRDRLEKYKQMVASEFNIRAFGEKFYSAIETIYKANG
jgi:glycosyltransferase involved in cell wall biosynthesis